MPRPLPKKISQIKPVLTNVALTSHYAVEFAGLSSGLRTHLGLRGIDSRYISETIGLLCSRASLPGSGFATADITGNFVGVTEKMAHTRAFTPISLEFYVDNGYRSLKFLEHWMEFISSGSERYDNQPPTSPGYYFRMRYPSEYKCDQTRIIKFEKDYKRYIEYRFYGLFPLSLDSTTVSYEGSNILKASATFYYDRYISGQSSSLSKFLGNDSNKDPAPSGTGTGIAIDSQSNLVYGGTVVKNGVNTLDLVTTAGAPLSNAGEYFKKGSSILNPGSGFTVAESVKKA